MTIAIKKICPICGKRFTAKRKDKTYCSRQCNCKHNNQIAKEMRKSHTRHCRQCGGAIPAGRVKYCSNTCKLQAEVLRRADKALGRG